MTLDDVLQELIIHLESGDKVNIGWEQVRYWPEGAIEIFLEAKWIEPSTSTNTLVCPGCEENCFMPVQVRKSPKKETQAFVACDIRDDMGRVPIPLDHLNQWQITPYQVARWIHKTLGLKGQPKQDAKAGTIRIGTMQGKKESGEIFLTTIPPVSFHTCGKPIPFGDIAFMKDQQPALDVSALKRLVDRSAGEEKQEYEPSVVRREARKLKTRERHKGWQKACRELGQEHPKWSGERIALEISNMKIGTGVEPATILRIMKGEKS